MKSVRGWGWKRSLAALCAAFGLPWCAPVALAVEPPKPVSETPMLDPWVPPGTVKKRATDQPSQGTTLAEQVERKLKASFDAADTSGKGAITRAEAAAAGLGYIANNFDAIDRDKSGSVRFEDVKAYLNSRGAGK